MVEKIRDIFDIIISRNKPIDLVMILFDNMTNNMTILVSAKWLDTISPYEGTKLIASYLFENLNKEEIKKVSRINLINTCDKSVIMLLNSLDVIGSIMYVGELTSDVFNTTVKDFAMLECHSY